MSKNSKVPNKNKQRILLRSKFAQKLVLSFEFQKSKSGSESAPPRHHECQFLDKTDNFEFFGLNFG